MSDVTPGHAPPSAIPEPANLTPGDLRAVLAAGWRDFARAPLYGVLFSAVYVLGGVIMYAIFSAAAAELSQEYRLTFVKAR